MPKTIKITLPATTTASYPIVVQSGVRHELAKWLPHHLHKIVIITDHNVRKLYADSLANILQQQGHSILVLSFPAGEKSKHCHMKNKLEERMLRAGCNRDTVILAVGGGVVGDMAGFIAATYMRGIPYIQVPTTLLAMLDSSIGGKTGVNTAYGKNLLGAFWQPHAVIADSHCLRSLPPKQLINGLIEALKMFLTSDKNSVQFFQHHLTQLVNGERNSLENLIVRALKIKAQVVQQDEREQHIRVILNFGHTIGHALEKITHYTLLHGYAVGYGILVEAKIAQLLGLLSAKEYAVIQLILAKLGIVASALKKYSVQQIIRYTQLDKKVRLGKVNYVLLTRLGQVQQLNRQFAQPVADTIVKQAWMAVIEE